VPRRMLRVEVAHHEDAWVLVDYLNLKERVEGEGIRREVGLHERGESYLGGICGWRLLRKEEWGKSISSTLRSFR